MTTHTVGSSPGSWNISKFESNLERRVQNRYNYDSNVGVAVTRSNAQTSSGLFAQFLLIGIPPDKTADDKAQILMAFPPCELPGISLAKIVNQCLPTGPKRNYLRRNAGHILQDEFVFTFTNGLQTMYAICVQTTCKNFNPFFASNDTLGTTYCYCLVSTLPVFGTHFTFLTYLALLCHGTVSEPHPLEQDLKVQIPDGAPIEGLEIVRDCAYNPSIKVPNRVIDELLNFYVLTVKSQPVKLSKSLIVTLQYPNVPPKKMILWSAFDTLFSVLEVNDILTVFTALLCDAQVVVLGRTLQEISMTVLALDAMLNPFKFSGLVIPILPAEPDYIDFLQSPTPFLIGVVPNPLIQPNTFLKTTLFVNLDKHVIAQHDSYPKIPNHQQVIHQLNTLLNSFVCSEESHPYGFPPSFTRYLNHKYNFGLTQIDQIMETVHRSLSQFYTDMIFCFFVTDTGISEKGVTVFNQELFLSASADSEKAFYSALIDSQTFQMFVEKRIADFNKAKSESSELVPKSSFQTVPANFIRPRKHSRTRSIEMSDYIEAKKARMTDSSLLTPPGQA